MRYLLKASYTAAGAKGVLEEGGTARRTTIENLAAGMGGSIETFDFAFGDTDVYVIAEMPDHATAAAISMAVGASGAASIETVVLVTPEEIDEAAKKSVGYRPPGA